MEITYKHKIKEWLNRYLVPTLLSVVLSVSLAMLMDILFHNAIITALGGTWGDNLGFYGLILYKDVRERKARDERLTILGILKVLRNAVAEFGVAEYLDSFLIRPSLMYIFPEILGNKAVGIIIAKFAADITFFVPTIIFYEIRKKVFKD